jgi:uncharacterized cupin superfamily protein
MGKEYDKNNTTVTTNNVQDSLHGTQAPGIWQQTKGLWTMRHIQET